ncbi:hypothetical protein OS493_030490 [Desmophyllum pertusum]|uniref:Uncharacterized protein n=1 Tax=Desmophyllum pertusum TaxID=174260 RepID=A0A9W9YWG2_9CNID|nr:hypothetical protein OS493_030490 [Desmophyllum pertusum]
MRLLAKTVVVGDNPLVWKPLHNFTEMSVRYNHLTSFNFTSIMLQFPDLKSIDLRNKCETVNGPTLRITADCDVSAATTSSALKAASTITAAATTFNVKDSSRHAIHRPSTNNISGFSSSTAIHRPSFSSHLKDHTSLYI